MSRNSPAAIIESNYTKFMKLAVETPRVRAKLKFIKNVSSS
jgi:hypothetical protein